METSIKRYTPDNIVMLRANEVFVFGSNEAGIHGAGAAQLAHAMFGAKYGQGFGMMGKSFGIPTKDWSIKNLGLSDIEFYVRRFIRFTKLHPELVFLVTKIGCGLAGYVPRQIAPMFDYPEEHKNVILPVEFAI
jgi:hypothetical protein